MSRLIGGVILFLFMMALLFFEPVQVKSILFPRKKSFSQEQEVIGSTVGFNPRVRGFQKILRELGYDDQPIDGNMDGRTRKSIREFQIARGLNPTGEIDYRTLVEFNRYRELKERAISQYRSSLKKKDNPGSKVQGNTPQIARDHSKAKTDRHKRPESMKQIQSALARANFYKGKIDGIWGPQTEAAVKAFQKSKGLVSDGIVGPLTWRELQNYLNG